MTSGESGTADGFEPFWAAFSCFDAGSVVELIGEADAAVNAAEARRLAWIATRHDQVIAAWDDGSAVLSSEVAGRRFTDALDQVVGEVGAAIGRGASAARAAVELAVALRDRVPRVFECLSEGLISVMAARAVVRRCAAVTDPAVLHRVDVLVASGLVRRIRRTGVLTEAEVRRLTDGVLAKLDPDAVPTPVVARRRGMWFDARCDGLVELAGLLLFEDAALVEREIERVAGSVCRKDPRTLGERRTDALVALVEGYTSLGCGCDDAGCVKRERVAAHATTEHKTVADVSVVISEATLVGVGDDPVLVADQPVAARVGRDLLARVGEARFHTLGTVEDPTPEASPPPDSVDPPVPPDPDATDVSPSADAPSADAACVDAACVDAACAAGDVDSGPPRNPVAESGSAVRSSPPGRRGGARSGPRVYGHHIAGYRPSVLQVRVLRIRYPQCVFPGCAVPFTRCQLDHVTERNHRDPAAGGQTRIGKLVSR